MNLNGEHKALIITLSLSVVLLLFLGNLNFIEQKVVFEELFEAETLVEIIPEDLDSKELTAQKASETNQAFNESQKDMAQAYEVIKPAEDFNYEDFKEENAVEVDEVLEQTENGSANTVKKTKPIDRKKIQSFDRAKRVLELQKKSKNKSSNKNSSVSYNLVNREANRLPIPVYLCDGGGKIIVNITVNKSGKVTSAKVNTGLSSSNLCLQDYALQYAKKASFNLGLKNAQLGTITYHFQ